MSDPQQPLNYEPAPAPTRSRDDIAYVAPMMTFLALTWAGTHWPDQYPIFYAGKALVVCAMLVALWNRYTPVRWDYWWLGVVVGVIGIVQWVGMQLWLQQQFDFFDPSGDAFNPESAIANPSLRYAFYAVRLFGAVLVVPVMEELFWRDFLWRSILAPNDFKLAAVGEWAWAPFLIVAGAFAFVHGNWWLTSIVWALMIGGLLAYTKSLGACIIAHAVTNLLLGIYVLITKQWYFW